MEYASSLPVSSEDSSVTVAVNFYTFIRIPNWLLAVLNIIFPYLPQSRQINAVILPKLDHRFSFNIFTSSSFTIILLFDMSGAVVKVSLNEVGEFLLNFRMRCIISGTCKGLSTHESQYLRKTPRQQQWRNPPPPLPLPAFIPLFVLLTKWQNIVTLVWHTSSFNKACFKVEHCRVSGSQIRYKLEVLAPTDNYAVVHKNLYSYCG